MSERDKKDDAKVVTLDHPVPLASGFRPVEYLRQERKSKTGWRGGSSGCATNWVPPSSGLHLAPGAEATEDDLSSSSAVGDHVRIARFVPHCSNWCSNCRVNGPDRHGRR